MRRRMAVGLCCLSLVGCAQSKPLLTKQDKAAPEPVAITPVPSIHDTINRGLGGTSLAAKVLPDPKSERWAGMAPPPGASAGPPTAIAATGAGAAHGAGGASAPAAPAMAAVGTAGAAGTAGTASPAAPAVTASDPLAAGSAAAPTSPVASGGLAPAAVVTETAPAAALPAASRASTASAAAVPARMGLVGASPAPTALEPAASEPLRQAANPVVDAGDLPPVTGLPPLNPPPSSSGTVPAVAVGAGGPSPARPASDSAVNVSSATRASEKAPPAARVSDPLLGPNPDLMPPLPPLPDAAPAAKSGSTAPAGASSPPPLDIQPAPAAAPAAAEQGGAVPLSSRAPSGSMMGGAGLAAAPAPLPIADLGLEKSPEAGAAAPANSSAAGRGSLRDGRVVLAALPGDKAEPDPTKKRPRDAGRPAARVGEEVITFRELVMATKDNVAQMDRMSGGIALTPAAKAERQRQLIKVTKQTLENLIEQTMLAQEAKQRIKDPKQLDRLFEAADKLWRDDEVPALKRQYQVKTDQDLRERLTERGRSFEALHRSFRQTFLAQNYLQYELRDRIKVELPDLLRYYNEHLSDHMFDRPALITWREIVVEKSKHPSAEAARRKADGLVERLKKGEGFADLARSESEGPTTARLEGGLMRTAPGAYRVASVNHALDTLSIGRPSEILEGDDGFHIVRVEGRRPAGPATFEEVQDKIKPFLMMRKRQEETLAFLGKLREKTLVTTIFDPEPNDLNRPVD